LRLQSESAVDVTPRLEQTRGLMQSEAHANSMSNPDTDKVFSGSIPTLYETYLVPLIFEPYAADLVNRLASRSLTRVFHHADSGADRLPALHQLNPHPLGAFDKSEAH
jgi:hypothetical protein